MLFIFLVVVVLFPMPSLAEITKIVIDKREPFAASHEFAVSGAYEKLIGKAYGEIDPKKHHNNSAVRVARRRRFSLVLQVEAPELLQPLSGLHLGGVDVALPVDGDVVERGELADLAAGPAEAR